MKAAAAKDMTDTLTVEIPPSGKDSTGKDEMNLAEFPITVLADRPPKGVKTLVFSHGKGKLIVTGSDAFGLPTALDDDVILALIQLTKQKTHFAEPTVNFTRYELLRLLGWANEGKSYRRLDESLKRWTGVTLIYEKCWWDNRTKQNVDANIHIIDDVVIFDGGKRLARADSQHPLPLSTFTWNSRFMESFQADNLKNLNLELYFSLKLAPAKRLYRFLDKRFYRRPELTFPIEELAFTRVGFSPSYGRNVAKIKEKLQPAITELETVGFLEPLTREERYFKDSVGWKVRMVKGKASPALPPPPEALPLGEPEPPPLVAELTRRGVTAKTAEELVRQYPADFLEEKIEQFDWEMRQPKPPKRPAGYLVKSIKDAYAPSTQGFEPAAERRRKQEERQAKELADAEERRRQREADAEARREKELIAGFWDGLSKELKAEHDAAAIAQADAEELKLIEPGPLKRFGMTVIRTNYARKLLQAQGELPPAEA